MSARRGRLRRALLVVAALAAVAIAGCAKPTAKPPQAIGLSVYEPCVISTPLRKVVRAYETAHPQVGMWEETGKPLALPDKVKAAQERPAVAITLGEVEMKALEAAGVVGRGEARAFAVNTYPLAVIVPSKSTISIAQVSDLASSKVKRVYLDDPDHTTLGDRGRAALKKLGLWDKVAPKLVRFDPNANLAAELLAGKADAAIVYRDCLFAEGSSPPKTVRLVVELPTDSYLPSSYQVAVVKTAPQSEAARQFVDFLVSPEGQAALRKAGLTPSTKQ